MKVFQFSSEAIYNFHIDLSVSNNFVSETGINELNSALQGEKLFTRCEEQYKILVPSAG